MNIIERLYQYIEFKDIKPTRFEKEVGLGNGYLGTQLRRSGEIGSGILKKIIENCQDLSLEWLVTGEGKMIRDGQSVGFPEPTASDPLETNDKADDTSQNQETILLERIIATQQKTIEALEARIADLEGQKRKEEKQP